MQGVDGGACGILDEYTFVRQYGPKVIEYLKAVGHECIDCTPASASSMGDSLAQGVNKANAVNADLFVSFHANSFNGSAHGSEVVCGSQTGINIGTRVVNNLSNLGLTNRSAYIDTRGLYEIKHTNMVALIIEPLFVDSQTDIDILNSIGLESFAKAIAEGIHGQTIQINKPQEVKKMKGIIVYHGDGDTDAAKALMIKKNFPIISRLNFTEEIKQCIDPNGVIYKVGGVNDLNDKRVVLISGKDRTGTTAAVLKYLGCI